ncbi:MAG TPA: DUF4209 domain-containing protein [Archangium sp.]|nr:DUF4209 domain-containing protein [Archangium sp.]
MDNVDQLTDLVRMALPGAKRWSDVADALRKPEKPSDEDPVWAAIWAFDYMLLNSRSAEKRERWGDFAPAIEIQGRVHPPPLKTLPDKVVATWAALADRLTDPVAASRLNDLLWVKKWAPKPHERARAAVSAYVALAQEDWGQLVRAECLARALELALAMKDAARATEIVPLIVAAAREAIASKDLIPGVTFRHIEALVGAGNVAPTADVDALLRESGEAYSANPYYFESVKDLEATWARKDKDRVARAAREKAERWKEVALAASGLQRHSLLQKAVEVARLHGLRDLVADLRGELQKMRLEDLGLSTHEVSAKISQQAVDRILAFMAGGADWRECLSRFGSYGPPSGTFEKNVASVQELMRKYPLQFMFERIVLDAEGRPIRRIATEQEHLDAGVIDREAQQIYMWGHFAPSCLKAIFDRYSMPSPEDLTAFFTTEFITPDVAERIARSLLLYHEGQFDESLHILIPRLEAVVRELCSLIGAVIIREPDGAKPGGVVALGELMSVLQGQFPESWRRYLRNLLNEPTGLNLRNRVSHGLLPRGGPAEAALALHAACFLRLLNEGQPADPETPPD